jgi:hypothetical protein
MESKAKAGARRLGPRRRGRNGKKFLKQSIEEWFLSCSELTFIDPCEGEAGYLTEKRHMDGPMSVFHGALTLSGARDLFCEVRGSGRVCVPNRPGTMYLGNLTGPRHQVVHRRCDHDSLLVPGLGHKSVTIMLRTGLFPHGNSRRMGCLSNPPAFKASVANSFVASMQVDGLRLPTFDVVLAEHKERAGCNSTKFTAGSASAAAPAVGPAKRTCPSGGRWDREAYFAEPQPVWGAAALAAMPKRLRLSGKGPAVRPLPVAHQVTAG